MFVHTESLTHDISTVEKQHRFPYMDSTSTTKPILSKSTQSSTNQQNPNDTPPATPTEMSSAAYKLAEEIHRIYSTLRTLTSLAPSPKVNALLTRLVELCIQPHSSSLAAHVLSLPRVSNLCLALRPLCATAEGELEKYWANRILNSSSPTASPSPVSLPGQSHPPAQPHHLLNAFPYHQNYIDLSRLECNTLESFLPLPTQAAAHRPSLRNLAFIGSGPLPLSSFCILDRYPEAHVHNIDRDAEALKVSKALAEKLKYGARMSWGCEDVSVDFEVEEGKKRMHEKEEKIRGPKWSEFQVVILAALVGMDTQSKLPILASLAAKLAPGTLVLVRSAQGLRGVIYPVRRFNSIFRLLPLLLNILIVCSNRSLNFRRICKGLGMRSWLRCIRGRRL